MKEKFTLYWIATTLLLTSCASVSEYVKSSLQKPAVRFTGAKINQLSFQSIGLLFDVQVTNPNPVGVHLVGFDYDFSLNQQSFVTGEQDQGVDIAARGSSSFQIPVKLNFDDLYQTFRSFRNRDSTDYDIACGISVNMPVLGTQRIPVHKKGTFPLLKLPQVQVTTLKVNKLGFTGADLQLNVSLNNPNPMTVVLKAFNYGLEINGSQWAKGQSSRAVTVAAKAQNVISIPISLNFLQIGQSVAQVLRSDQLLHYNLAGDLQLTSDLPLLGEVRLPFDRQGEIQLQR